MAKIPCTNHCPPAICPYSSSINKIYWRQFPVTHRWNLLLQLFNLSPNLLILIIFPQSIVQIPVLIPLCAINLSIISKCMSLSPFYFIMHFSLFNLKRVCYKKGDSL